MLGTRTATGKHGLFWLLGQLFKKKERTLSQTDQLKGKKNTEHAVAIHGRGSRTWPAAPPARCQPQTTRQGLRHTVPILIPTRALLWEHTGTAPALQALELLGCPRRRRNAAVFRGISESKRAQTSLLLSNTKSSPLKRCHL